MKAGIATLGCKVNQYESQVMMDMLCAHGFEPVSDGEQADVFIVNSCTVTGTSDKKVRQTVRRARRENPDAVMVLTGCMPQAFPEACESIEEADIVIGNSNRSRLPEYIEKFMSTHQRIIDITPHGREYGSESSISGMNERTRAYIKIEDGCNRFCSYCIIPYARGRVRSRSPEEIRAESQRIGKHYREVVLVGINLSAYGSDIGTDLLEAVRAAASADGIERVRLGSLEPDLTSDELIEGLAAEPKFCPQFHLAIQSGCDATLKRMNRHYDTAEFRRVCEKIRATFENPSITTDIMVGFAGETEEEFRQSVEFAKEIKFARAHVFAYSRRKGTRADSMPNQVDEHEKSLRSEIMIEATSATAEEFLRSQIGRTVNILAEREIEDGVFEGYTENYTPAKICGKDLGGRIVTARVIGVDGGFAVCEKVI
ncbi:MAG: tRNA (N(6)-L-threonylcarbamoyladenosine(37)-C(2))-methylthiotransferase MtaB [Firmicutes bacterium]|nr:tRNA (N(6)-L-threonylcarbamoyladenosine(37)-C(2))-methylthiotransferase MtaB [Bacillota bacterium]